MTEIVEFDNIKVNGNLTVYGCINTIETETIINKQIKLLPPQEIKTEDMVKILFDRVGQLEKDLMELKNQYKVNVSEISSDMYDSDCN